MKIDLNSYGLEELFELNKLVVSEIRARQKEVAKEKSSSFKIGQRVWFTDRSGKRVEGILRRFMPKNLAIDVDNGVGGIVKWKVSPHLVKAVEASGHEIDPIESLGGKEVDTLHSAGVSLPSSGSDTPIGVKHSVW
jgi:hypothetical protein